MNKDKIINWVVVFLIAFGSVLVLEKLIVLSPYQAFEQVAEISRYASIPLGLGVKLFQYLDSRFKKMEEIKAIALANRSSDESIREQIQFLHSESNSSKGDIANSLLSLEKRMIVLEARSEMSTKLERLERLLNEQIDRINKLS